MIIKLQTKLKLPRKEAMSLVEAVVALAIAGVAIAALVGGFIFLLRRSEAAAYSVAANSLALSGYEQARAAKWDALSLTNVDELVASNYPPRGMVLDIPRSGNNVVYATNYTTISTISTNPLLKVLRVDCVYPFLDRGLFTNSIVSYRATETGQQNAQPSSPPLAPTLPPPAGTSSATNSRANATNIIIKDPTVAFGGSSGTGSGKKRRGRNGGQNGG